MGAYGGAGYDRFAAVVALVMAIVERRRVIRQTMAELWGIRPIFSWGTPAAPVTTGLQLASVIPGFAFVGTVLLIFLVSQWCDYGRRSD